MSDAAKKPAMHPTSTRQYAPEEMENFKMDPMVVTAKIFEAFLKCRTQSYLFGQRRGGRGNSYRRGPGTAWG